MPRWTHPCVRNDRSNVRGMVRLFANAVMIACLAAALWGVGAEAFCLTVFFVVWILRISLPVATRWLEAEPDTVIYFAPWVNKVTLPRNTVSLLGWSSIQLSLICSSVSLIPHHSNQILTITIQVFPAYTYDARTGNLVDETPVTRQAFSGLLVGVAWGIAVAIFVEPLGIGVVSS